MNQQLNREYKVFSASKLDLESYFQIQIVLLTIRKTKWFIDDRFKTIRNKIVLIPQRYKRTKSNWKASCKLFYADIKLQDIHSMHPIEVSTKNSLPLYLGYNFSLDKCFENRISLEYYKLAPHKMKKFLCGYNSNSVPGKCNKWETKLKIGVLDDKFFWLPSNNLIMNQLYCSKDNCLVSNHFPFSKQKHESFCSNEQKVHTKQVSYGNQCDELDSIIKQNYLPKSFANYRAKNFAVFDIECLENKIDTVAPEYGFNVLANQSVCSIGKCSYHKNIFRGNCIYSGRIKYS